MASTTISIGGTDRPCDQEAGGTARERIADAATAHGWTADNPATLPSTTAYRRGPDKVTVKFDSRDRIVLARHFAYGRWIRMEGLDRAQRVINVLSAER